MDCTFFAVRLAAGLPLSILAAKGGRRVLALSDTLAHVAASPAFRAVPFQSHTRSAAVH